MVVFRDFQERDRQTYYKMSLEFYEGAATLCTMDEQKLKASFDLALRGSPLMRGVTLEDVDTGRMVGYGLLAFYWSNEAGGLAVQLEDSYGYWDGGEYYISGDDYGLFVSLWNDSLVTLCKEAAGGDQDALDQWETIVSDLRALSAESYQTLESYDLDSMNVDIVISGQEDMDLYLIVSNGEITYDYTRDGAL